MRSRPLLLVLLSTLALAVPPAWAGLDQESVFEDDYLLLQRGTDQQQATLEEIATLGAETVRALVYWNSVAPRPAAAKRPAGFKPASVTSYPARGWDRYDDLVRGATARGLKVLLTPTSPIPRWASACAGSARKVRACRPDAKLYGGFVQALAKRYSGTYADENQGGGVLPRVDRWSLWNEPNQPGWLNPQFTKIRGGVQHTAPVLYRSLARAGIAGLRAAGQGSSLVLLGETAPIGAAGFTRLDTRTLPQNFFAKRAMAPATFIRALLCLDSRGRRARGPGCSGFGRLAVDGFAHHPYTKGGSQPPLSGVGPGEITIRNGAALRRLLDQGARARHLPPRLTVWYTEFGYQTNPPDRLFGVSLAQQAEFINQSDYIAARDSRVRAVAQYKLVDEQDQASFQTGLRMFGTLKPKPAYAAYQLPIWAVRRGSSVSVYGQVRAAPAGSAETVEIQNQPASGGGFETVRTVAVSNRTGQFLVRVPARAGFWRLRWAPAAGGDALTSRVARAGRR